MGNLSFNGNIFRDAIISGFKNDLKIRYNTGYYHLYYNQLVCLRRILKKYTIYGLIIKPLYMEDQFKLPIKMYFKGYPYHVGILVNETVYSFCPDLENPHRGSLSKDIKKESVFDWIQCSNTEIFIIKDVVINNKLNLYDLIQARLEDLIQVRFGNLSIDDFNIRYNTELRERYNLMINNCEDLALTVLIGDTKSYQINAIKHIILPLMNNQNILRQLPGYAKFWVNDMQGIDKLTL